MAHVASDEQLLIEQWSDAIWLATDAHHRQFDKEGLPYILHPLEVMQRATTTEEKIVAILHDVVEDTYVSMLEIRRLFTRDIADAIQAISRDKDKETYFEYIDRLSKNELAVRIKLIDLSINMARVPRLPEAEQSIMKRYLKAQKILMHLGEEV